MENLCLSENPAEPHTPPVTSRRCAGFPSPADDYIEKTVDLNELLIPHPVATFLVQVKGDSMFHAGIHTGDTLIVDRSLKPENGQILVAVVNGEFTVKRFEKRNGKLYLDSGNPEFRSLEITGDMEFEIWGIVTHVIHKVK